MKQKGLRKLVSMILAVVMVLAMSANGFAATSSATTTGTITINNVVSGQTYTIYQLATVTYNTDNEAYTYTATEEWLNFLESEDAKSYVSVATGTNYLTWVGDTSDSDYAAFAQLAQTYAADTSNEVAATATKTAKNNTVIFSNLSLGWYLVDTSLGALCDLTTTIPNASISEKNGTPTVDKVIVEDGTEKETNAASVGDVISYETTISDVAGASNLELYDTLGTGLTLNQSSIEVTYYASETDESGTVLTADTDYSITKINTESFTIDFSGYASTLKSLSSDSDAYILVKYTATVNSSATTVDDGSKNETYVKYGEGTSTATSTHDTTTTYVFGIDVFKYTNIKSIDEETQEEIETKTGLADAKFILYRSEIEVIDEEGGGTETTVYYAVVTEGKITGWTKTKDDATRLVSNSYGEISVDGLGDGKYYLEETEAPAGYNILTSPIVVNINGTKDEDGDLTGAYTVAVEGSGTVSNNVVYVENNKGSQLPSTGGMGTTIFYIVGGVLVLGAAVLFVTKRRLGSEN